MVEVSSLSLVVGGVFFYLALYLFLKHYLVRLVCEPLVRARRGKGVGTVAAANGVANGSHANGSAENGAHSELLSDATVAKLAEWLKAGVLGLITTIASLVILWQARDDFLHGRSWFLEPYAHSIIGYFAVDTYVMYDGISTKHRTLSFSKKLAILFKAKWAFLVHHIVVFIVLYPICIFRTEVRHDIGDFYIGTFLIRELMHPFAAINIVLQMLDMQDTKIYFYNGCALVISFFVTRIITTPICVLIYAAQHHKWDVWAALGELRWYCYLFLALEFLLQLYWFIGITRKALGEVLKRRNKAE